MNLVLPKRRRAARLSAFTIAEAVVAMALLGLVSTGLYGGISMSYRFDQFTRENLRATQILAQNMEVIRLCRWSQTDPATNYIPTSFSVYYDPSASNGVAYAVQLIVTNPPSLATSYSNDLRMLTATATWTSGGVQHSRSMSTFISRAGLLWYAP